MSRCCSETDLINIVKQSKLVLITAHEFPDLDAVGSCLALRDYLIKQGKEVAVWLSHYPDETCNFLPGISVIDTHLPEREYDTIFILDSSDITRVKHHQSLSQYPHATKINIDHHQDNTYFADFNYIKSVSSVGELLTQWFKDINASFSSSMATCLYAAILFDTGRFLHQNVTKHTLELASFLVEKGANPADIAQCIYENKTTIDFELLKLGLNRMVIHETLGYAYTTLPYPWPEGHLKVIDIMKWLKNITVCLVFQELQDGFIKISLRSRYPFDVSAVANHFGGGGHRLASGIKLKGTLEEVEEMVITYVCNSLERFRER